MPAFVAPSGGQAVGRRAVPGDPWPLCCWPSRLHSCWVMEEPTNSLDLDSVAQLFAALRQYRGAVLVASHDEPFLAQIGITRRLDLSDG